jgi:hypothetical protein
MGGCCRWPHCSVCIHIRHDTNSHDDKIRGHLSSVIKRDALQPTNLRFDRGYRSRAVNVAARDFMPRLKVRGDSRRHHARHGAERLTRGARRGHIEPNIPLPPAAKRLD